MKVVALTLLLLPPSLPAQLEPGLLDGGAVGLGMALRRLGTTTSVLFVTAHPDDESNAILTYLSLGRGYRVGLLTLTRGAGGQNEIGSELGTALSVLRTEELLSVHRRDRVEQFFGRAVDFGYSFSVEETFKKWNREETLGDIVRVLRTFRPDAVITMMPGGTGGGQHHQASARLAELAFRAAGDPGRYPEQLREGLEPWKPKRLYRRPFRLPAEERKNAVAVPVGTFDMLLGMSYAEFGALVRNNHRSQGMNAPPIPGSQTGWLVPVEAPREPALFANLDDGLAILRALWSPGAPRSAPPEVGGLERAAEGALAAFRRSDWEAVAVKVMNGLRLVRSLRRRLEAAPGDAKKRLDFLLAAEEREWNEAAALAHQLFCEAMVVPSPADPQYGGDPYSGSADGLVTPGEDFFVETTLASRHPGSLTVAAVRIVTPPGWSVETVKAGGSSLPNNEAVKWLHKVRVATGATPTRPFWYRGRQGSGRYDVRVPAAEALRPFLPPDLRVEVTYESRGTKAVMRKPVMHRWYDPAAAKRRGHAVKVVPGLSVRVHPPRLVVRLGTAGERKRFLTVRLHSNFPQLISAEVRLKLPPGWRSAPAAATVPGVRENEERSLRFRLIPPEKLAEGTYTVEAEAHAAGKIYRQGYRTVAYHHIETRHAYEPATALLEAFPVAVAAGLDVGYIMGVGDEVPRAIEELGARVALLEAGDLATGDLAAYDAIVTGVRAYKDRADLIASNSRLLEYVRRGGVVIVQYNKYEFNAAQYGPYACSISMPHDRVTDEASPVRLLVPEHPAFHRPNKIGPADWEGWVQERGLYFLGSWDERYTPLIELEDPFEYNPGPKRGALVVARDGKGIYIYTGLAFFRQLPAGVPGAYRLFANLISLGKTRER